MTDKLIKIKVQKAMIEVLINSHFLKPSPEFAKEQIDKLVDQVIEYTIEKTMAEINQPFIFTCPFCWNTSEQFDEISINKNFISVR